MKIFVTYASAGSGHFKAAQAVYNYFNTQDSALDIRLIDVLQNSNFLFKNIYTHGYLFLINHALWLWRIGFYVTCNKPFIPFFKRLQLVIDISNIGKARRLFTKENPDLIISTHFLPSQLATYLKNRNLINSKIFTVITDFGVHPFWLADGTDTYIVASDYTKRVLSEFGVPQEKIKATGIPIDLKFSQQYDKNVLSNKFSLNLEKFKVLIVTGSFGIGPVDKIVRLLRNDFQLLVVCANNKRLYAKLKTKDYPDVKTFGFVNNIHELMAVADIIITKPGGLTISELLSMKLIPIFISKIHGQETANAKILKNFGIGIIAQDLKEIKRIIVDYKLNPDKITIAKQCIRALSKPFAVRELYNAVCKNSIRPTC